MAPWPADVQASFNLSPTTSPMQQAQQDPFADGNFAASFGGGAPAPGMPQLGGNQASAQQQQQQQQQQQPPPQQQPGYANSWATMTMNMAQAQGAPTSALVAPVGGAPTPNPSMIGAPVGAPAAMPQADFGAPPPAVVVADSRNKTPPSPIGDVSVMAAAGLSSNATVVAAPPSVPIAMGGMQQQPLQLQPNAQPMMQMMQGAAAPAQAPTQPAPAAVPSNPFDFGPVAFAVPQAPPPANSPPRAPPSPSQPTEQQQQQQLISPPVSPVQANSFAPQSNAYADPFGYAFTPMASPVTSPVTSPNASPTGGGALVQSTKANVDPFGVGVPGGVIQQPGGQMIQARPAGMPPSIPNFDGAPSQQQPAPQAQAPNFGAPQPTPPAPDAQAVVPSVAPNADPFGVFGSQPAPAPNANPFGSSALVPSGPAPAGAGAADDPFGIFGSPSLVPAPAPEPAQAPAPVQQPQEEDPWATAGFNQAVSASQQPDSRLEHANSVSSNHTRGASESKQNNEDEAPVALDSNGLPDDGEYYEARINARSLGAMFYTAHNLEETLYHKLSKNVIKALASRPVVAYVAENSAAYNSGIHLGHVILSVNGHPTEDPEFCAKMIRNAPRPMTIRCWVPPAMELTLNEGRHLVKYDTKDLEAPNSSVEWKRKYIVVGGIVTKPWMMNMFYRKKDYDIAVKEAHAGHKISVKVKQFDLRGARIILKGKDGKPNWVDYPSERKPWYYITILPSKGYPIKISSESLEELEPVYSAIRRFVRKDMEARYQYRMDSSFGYGSSGRGDGGGGSRSSSNSRLGGFQQFNDAPRSDYWR